ncbi:MAG: hypothetical protein QM773_17805 [Hyphomonadaceae bacterium]
MKRLDTKSLPHFLDTAGVAVVLLGFDDAATMKQAEEFALLWASCQEEGLVGIQFGYVDGETNRDAWDMLGASVAPCLAIVRQGVVTRRLEGHRDHQEIAAIMRQPASFPWRRQRASLSPGRAQEQREHVAA